MAPKTLFSLLFGLVFASATAAQHSGSNVQEAFLPYETGTSTEYRSVDGAPGEDYWQNSADYKIKTRLYPENHSIESTVKIGYTNNSPDRLESVWIQLDQNLFEKLLWGGKTYATWRFPVRK